MASASGLKSFTKVLSTFRSIALKCRMSCAIQSYLLPGKHCPIRFTCCQQLACLKPHLPHPRRCSRTSFRSSVKAHPDLPALAVRPQRCTYVCEAMAQRSVF